MKTNYSGKSVDAAVAKAATAMGVSVDELNYDVLAGQGGGFALIKINVPVASAPMVENLSGTPGSAPSPEREDDRPPRRDHPPRDADRGGRGEGGGRERGGRDGGGRDGGGPGRRDDRGGRPDDRGGRGGRDDRRGRDDRGPRRDRPPVPFPSTPEDAPTEATGRAREGQELSEAAQAGLDALVGILDRMDIGVEVVANQDVRDVVLDINCDIFHPLFVSKDLELLSALEQMVDRMVPQEGDDRLRFHVDSKGIKEQKELDLSQTALDMAEEAVEKGETMKIGPMDARSRRMVHLALQEHEGVTTHSEGQGAFRRVCIVPNE